MNYNYKKIKSVKYYLRTLDTYLLLAQKYLNKLNTKLDSFDKKMIILCPSPISTYDLHA